MSSCEVGDAGWLAWFPRSAYQRQLPSAKVSLGKLLVCVMTAALLYIWGLSIDKLNVMSCAKMFELA